MLNRRYRNFISFVFSTLYKSFKMIRSMTAADALVAPEIRYVTAPLPGCVVRLEGECRDCDLMALLRRANVSSRIQMQLMNVTVDRNGMRFSISTSILMMFGAFLAASVTS